MDADGAAPAAWRFDRFTLDLARGALLADGGAEVALRPKSFALLRLLVENPGHLLDRDAIMATVWPGVVVGDESITQCIRDVRKALGDEAQQVLKTVPKRGYLLAAEVTVAEAMAPAPRVERRLAAILAADVVGYSRLMEKDETGTFARLRQLREELIEPILQRHGGRFVDLKGDGGDRRVPKRDGGGRGGRGGAAGDAGSRSRAARGPAHPLPDRDQSRRRHRRRPEHLRRRHQRRRPDRGPVRTRRRLAVAQRPQPGQGQAGPGLRAQRAAPGQEHQRGGRDLPGRARRGGAG